MLGNCSLYIESNVDISILNNNILSNQSFININHTNAKCYVNNNIFSKNWRSVINLTNGKLYINSTIELLQHDGYYGDSAVIYGGGDLYINGGVLKAVLNTEQYPISNINIDKNIKILSGGLSLNRETFAARKQKIEIVVGGSVQNTESYTFSLSGVNYISSGYTTASEVVSGFTNQISSLTNFTIVNNDISFTVECNNVSETFTYATSKTVGTGTITQRLIRYATFPLTNSTGGFIVTDNDV